MSLFFKLKAAKKEYGDDAIVDSFGHVTTKDAIDKRENDAGKFWEDLSTTERMLGRKLTAKEQWKIIQRGEWRCVCCADLFVPESKSLAVCPTCHLKIKFSNGKIDVVGNMEEE